MWVDLMEIKVFRGLMPEDWPEASKEIYNSIIENKAVAIKDSEGFILSVVRSIYDHEQFDHPINHHDNDSHNGLEKISREDYSEDKDYIFTCSMWHCDESNKDWPDQIIPAVICMNMTTFSCDKKYGKTVFVDREKMLKELDKDLVNKIHDKYVLSVSDHKHLISEYDVSDFDIDEIFSLNQLFHGEDTAYSLRIHPALSTHPITNLNSLCTLGTGYSNYLISKDKSLRKDFKNLVNEYLFEKKNWVEWEWDEGDFLIWDNRSTIHSFSSGWTEEQRIFSRADTGKYIPYFDYNSYLKEV